jgi:ATP-dependent Clp protease ATP-binding subunit ClpA
VAAILKLSLLRTQLMYERFTDRARKVLQLANEEAQRFNHRYIGTEHVLLGLVREGSGVAAIVLKKLNIDLRTIRVEIEKLVPFDPEMVPVAKLPQTPRLKKVIEYAIKEARALNHKYVGTEHLLLGLLCEEGGVAAQVLSNLELNLEQIRHEVLQLLGDDFGQSVLEKTGPTGQAPQPDLRDLPADILEIVKKLDAQIEKLSKEKEEAVTEMDFEKAALLYERVHRLKKERADIIRQARPRPNGSTSGG